MAVALAASLLLSAVFVHWRWPGVRSQRLWWSAIAATALVLVLRTWWSVPVAAFLQALALSHPGYQRMLTWLRVPAMLAVMVCLLVAASSLLTANDLIHRSSAFAIAFALGQILELSMEGDPASFVVPRRIWVSWALIGTVGWLYAVAGPALRAPFACSVLVSALYLSAHALRRFDLDASLRASPDGATRTAETVAILLPFCFACRWVLY